MSNGRTLIELFEASVQRHSENPLMWEKKMDQYVATTYREAHEQVTQIAGGLLELGLASGDRVILLSEGRNDWVFAELAVLFCGAINVPVSVKLNQPNEIKFRCAHSAAKVAIVSARQVGKILDVKKDLPDLETVLCLDDVEKSDPDLITLNELKAKGVAFLQANIGVLEQRKRDVKGQTPANICYTSGTTADPKGIVLTHRNYTSNVEQAAGLYDIPDYFVSLLILPWDHSFAHTAGIYALMDNGASMAAIQVGKTMIETTKNISINIKEIQPHFLLSVPALSDKFMKGIIKGIEKKGLSKLVNSALKVAYAYQGDGFRNGKWQGVRALAPLYKMFDKIIFSKIRAEAFGGQLQYFVGGGALLDKEYQKFFTALGIPIYQGYGLSEASPIISANSPSGQKMGTSGRLVPNLDIKICDEDGNELPQGKPGEMVVRGENVMLEYWRNPTATAKTIVDGWLFSGDMGYVDEDKYLMVLGRYKSLLISDDGEKFSPEGIEETLLGRSIYIDQIMLYNSQSPYTTALVVPDFGRVKQFLAAKGLSKDTEEGCQAVVELFRDEIIRIQDAPDNKAQFPGKWFPKSFALLGEPFTEKNSFINSTMKMVRWKITEFYKLRLDYVYTLEGKNPVNHHNLTIVSRMSDAE